MVLCDVCFYSQNSDIPILTASSNVGEGIASMSPEDRQAMVNESLDMLSKLYVAYQLTQ